MGGGGMTWKICQVNKHLTLTLMEKEEQGSLLLRKEGKLAVKLQSAAHWWLGTLTVSLHLSTSHTFRVCPPSNCFPSVCLLTQGIWSYCRHCKNALQNEGKENIDSQTTGLWSTGRNLDTVKGSSECGRCRTVEHYSLKLRYVRYTKEAED